MNIIDPKTQCDFSHANVFRARFHMTKEDGAKFTDRSLARGEDKKLVKADTWESPF